MSIFISYSILIFSFVIELIYCQISSNSCLSTISPIDTAQFNATYMNVFMQFVPPNIGNISTNVFMQSNLLTFDKGNFGKLIINGNPNYEFQESKIYYTYSCSKLQISFPSLNKYWGNLTDFELILTFTLEKKTNGDIFKNLDNLMQNTIKVAFPILNLNVTNYSDATNMFMNLSRVLLNNKFTIGTNYIFPYFDLEMQFIQNDYLNNNKNFYFYVGNDANSCNYNILWIIMNHLIFLPYPYAGYLKNFFTLNNLDSTGLLTSYYSRNAMPRSGLTLYQNFYINYVSMNLEKTLLNSTNMSFKVIKKVIFMVMILLF